MRVNESDEQLAHCHEGTAVVGRRRGGQEDKYHLQQLTENRQREVVKDRILSNQYLIKIFSKQKQYQGTAGRLVLYMLYR